MSNADLQSLIKKPETGTDEPVRKTKGGMRRQKSRSTGNLAGVTRNISFGSNKTMVFQKQIDNDDEEHKNSVWFSHKEMKGIKKDLRESIKKGDFSRGLEQYQGGGSSREKRESHTRAILRLQQQQRNAGIQNDESMGIMSRALSKEDLQKAQALASKDSVQAFQEHSKTPATCITRTSSAKALDNFRKNMVLSTGALDRFNGNFNRGNDMRGGGKNATFSPKASSKTRRAKKTNMFLQNMGVNPPQRQQSPNPAPAPRSRVMAGVA